MQTSKRPTQTHLDLPSHQWTHIPTSESERKRHQKLQSDRSKTLKTRGKGHHSISNTVQSGAPKTIAPFGQFWFNAFKNLNLELLKALRKLNITVRSGEFLCLSQVRCSQGSFPLNPRLTPQAAQLNGSLSTTAIAAVNSCSAWGQRPTSASKRQRYGIEQHSPNRLVGRWHHASDCESKRIVKQSSCEIRSGSQLPQAELNGDQLHARGTDQMALRRSAAKRSAPSRFD